MVQAADIWNRAKQLINYYRSKGYMTDVAWQLYKTKYWKTTHADLSSLCKKNIHQHFLFHLCDNCCEVMNSVVFSWVLKSYTPSLDARCDFLPSFVK